MVKRRVGLVAAALLVVAGWGVRSWRDDEGGGGGGGPSADVTALHCVPELAELCRSVTAEVVVEPAATTYADLVLAGSDPVPWVTYSPWPAMVDDQRRRSGLAPLFDDAEPIAATEMAWVGWSERLAALDADCGLVWDCLLVESDWSAHGAPAAWGRVQVGVGDPARSTDAVRTLAWATGVDDDRVATDPEVDAVLRRLADRIPDLDPPAGSALEQMLVTGPAGFDVAIVPAAPARIQMAGSARAAQLDVAVPDPAAVVDVVAGGPGVRSLIDELRDLLLTDGWVAPDQLEGRPVDGGQAIAVWLQFSRAVR